MPLPLPGSLSPSKVSTFTECALAFRFSAIDRLPEPPSVPATKGSMVHRALELLFCEPAAERTPQRAISLLEVAWGEFEDEGALAGLGLDAAGRADFLADATEMTTRYFGLEDPTRIEPIGLELKLEAHVGDLALRGIIDRLDRTDDGDLIVVDYKTGKTPPLAQEQARLGGVHFYALMCEQAFGVRPREVQLIYLGSDPQIIVATPSEQSTRGVERKVTAIWSAIERACDHDDFRPKPSALCSWCAFKSFCPAFGGDPDAARAALDSAPAPAR